MKIAGIVAEYNPFHKGHAYQIEWLRERGFEGIVAAMSGNFVQRADTAMTDKYVRARAAVAGGADLILELPLPYAVASAEDFARGGIGILAATGIVDAVCCGCESGGEQNLRQYEALKCAEADGSVRKEMEAGKSYPSACRDAVSALGVPWSEEPNDVLALSYRKALERIAPEIPLITLLRKGSYHGESDGFAGAESIRKKACSGMDFSQDLPQKCYEIIADAPRSELSRLQRAILTFYRTADPASLKDLYAIREGMAERICRESGAQTLCELYDAVKTRRFPHSAVRRGILCGYLGIPSELPPISYLRVLAFNDRGREILRRMKNEALLPVCPILTPQMRDSDPLAALQIRGDEIFALTLERPGQRMRDLLESARYVPEFGKKF